MQLTCLYVFQNYDDCLQMLHMYYIGPGFTQLVVFTTKGKFTPEIYFIEIDISIS